MSWLERHLNLRQAAERLGLSVGTLYNLRSEGKLVEPDLVWDERPYWLAATIDKWDEGPTPRPRRRKP